MLFCVLGNSGVGKDTVIEESIFRGGKEGINIKRLPIYTSRPIRADELLNSSTYYNFVDDCMFDSMVNDGLFIEYREYKVLNNETWKYATSISDFYNAIKSNDFYIMPCTKAMFKSYYEFLSNSEYYSKMLHKLYPIYVTVASEHERLNRLIKRAKSTDELYEACRRFVNDVEHIYDETIPEEFTVINADLSDTVSNILCLIETFMDENPNDPWLIDCTCRDTFGGLLY